MQRRPRDQLQPSLQVGNPEGGWAGLPAPVGAGLVCASRCLCPVPPGPVAAQCLQTSAHSLLASHLLLQLGYECTSYLRYPEWV